jgi:hypothetical protein
VALAAQVRPSPAPCAAEPLVQSRKKVSEESESMKAKAWVLVPAALLILAAVLPAQWLAGQAAGGGDDNPDAKPPVTKADVRIVQRARKILNSQSEWNRADTRVCPAGAKTFSFLCVGKGH